MPNVAGFSQDDFIPFYFSLKVILPCAAAVFLILLIIYIVKRRKEASPLGLAWRTLGFVAFSAAFIMFILPVNVKLPSNGTYTIIENKGPTCILSTEQNKEQCNRLAEMLGEVSVKRTYRDGSLGNQNYYNIMIYNEDSGKYMHFVILREEPEYSMYTDNADNSMAVSGAEGIAQELAEFCDEVRGVGIN